MGTIFESSHIPLNKWLVAMYLMCSSKKSISAYQLQRSLGITYKSAWFLCHRIREVMTKKPLKNLLQGIVEVDETYVGGKKRIGSKRGRGTKKVPVLALVERNGEARSYKMDDLTTKTIRRLIRKDVEITSRIMTDEFNSYRGLEKEFAGHDTVDHSKKEYCRGIFMLILLNHISAYSRELLLEHSIMFQIIIFPAI
jgi:transposase-like protein